MAMAKSKTMYDVHPGVAMMEKWVAELKSKTGRSVEEWVALVKKEGPKEEKARREWLKNKHKLGMNSAWWIAERAGARAERKTRRKDTWRLPSGMSKSSTPGGERNCGQFTMNC